MDVLDLHALAGTAGGDAIGCNGKGVPADVGGADGGDGGKVGVLCTKDLELFVNNHVFLVGSCIHPDPVAGEGNRDGLVDGAQRC